MSNWNGCPIRKGHDNAADKREKARLVRFVPIADLRTAAPYSITLSADEHRADSPSILYIEPCVDNFLCLGNNRFFGTFLKRCRTFGQRR